jgi:hypothetical protein
MNVVGAIPDALQPVKKRVPRQIQGDHRYVYEHRSRQCGSHKGAHSAVFGLALDPSEAFPEDTGDPVLCDRTVSCSCMRRICLGASTGLRTIVVGALLQYVCQGNGISDDKLQGKTQFRSLKASLHEAVCVRRQVSARVTE